MENIKTFDQEDLHVEINFDGVECIGKVNDVNFTGEYNEVTYYIAHVLRLMYNDEDKVQDLMAEIVNLKDSELNDLRTLLPRIGQYSKEERAERHADWYLKFTNEIKPRVEI